MTTGAEQIGDALAPIYAMLEADGYLLEIGDGDDGDDVELSVTAGPDACAECLVPIDLFSLVVRQQLAQHGLDATFRVVYP